MSEKRYPYELVDEISKLDHVGLPPQDAFYSSLKQERISNEDYQHAQLDFKSLLCVLLEEYHLIYLKQMCYHWQMYLRIPD